MMSLLQLTTKEAELKAKLARWLKENVRQLKKNHDELLEAAKMARELIENMLTEEDEDWHTKFDSKPYTLECLEKAIDKAYYEQSGMTNEEAHKIKEELLNIKKIIADWGTQTDCVYRIM